MRHTAAFILLTLALAALTGCGTGPTGAQLRAESAARAAQATALIEDAKAADRMATAQAWRPPTLTPEPTATPTSWPTPTATATTAASATPTVTLEPTRPQAIVVVVTVNVTVAAQGTQGTQGAQGAQGQQVKPQVQGDDAEKVAMVVLALLVVIGALAAWWWFVLRPKERIEPHEGQD